MTTLVLEELSGEDLRHLAWLRDTELERERAREDAIDRRNLERLLPLMDKDTASQIREALDQVSLDVVLAMWWPHFYAARFGGAA